MASPRTVSVTVLLETTLPGQDASGVRALVDVVRACPRTESVLNSLRDGGWTMDGPPDADVDPGCLCVSFCKEFSSATPIDACEDARDCGVTDELGPVFDWTPDAGNDDDGAWDAWEGEL
jgi:hypothetical protein